MPRCKECKFFKPKEDDPTKGDCYGHEADAEMDAEDCPTKSLIIDISFLSARVAQLVEQEICNFQVKGSSPFPGFLKIFDELRFLSIQRI